MGARRLVLAALVPGLLALAAVPVEGGSAPVLPCGATLCPTTSFEPAVAVAAGGYQTCALLQGGNVTCWGDTPLRDLSLDRSPLVEPYDRGDAAEVSLGGAVRCIRAVTGGLECGTILDVDVRPPAAGLVLDAAVGHGHACALTAGGHVACAGTFGQGHVALGAVALASGIEHACALLDDGNVACWGTEKARRIFGVLEGYHGGDAVDLVSGTSHACVLTASGNAHCWGNNHEGQLMDRTSGDVRQVAAGGGHTCLLLASGEIQCQGLDNEGQASPPPLPDVRAIATGPGAYHTCALLGTGGVACWGDNAHGQSLPYPLVPVTFQDPTGPGGYLSG